MSAPDGFSWIERPRLAGMSQPITPEEYQWLRDQGIQLVVCLTENMPRRAWINDAGLFSIHVPIEDMTPPAQEQIDQCMAAIEKAYANKMGVAVHCGAGLGRTGTILACWLVHHESLPARDAIARIRRLRPNSIETVEQEDAIAEYSRRRKIAAESDVP
jgi:atypical dual specificity phosphatase